MSSLVPLCFGLVVLVRFVALFDGRDPAFDESSLLANFPLSGFGGYFQPLPLFEQATTLGHLTILDLSSRLFGDDRIFVIRSIAIE